MEKQFFAGDIKTPFVIGAIIDLGNCLNFKYCIVLNMSDSVKNTKRILIRVILNK